jgi:non-ribosomal peptide synthetase component F
VLNFENLHDSVPEQTLIGPTIAVNETIVDKFMAVVKQYPTTLVIDELTYAELNKTSNKVAHYLNKRGIGFRSKVGLKMKRNKETIIAMIGILKCGACYIPIDPDFPDKRIAYMIGDCEPDIVLETIEMDDNDEDINLSDLDALMYLIYTSGSTGNPKGCMITHRAVSNVVNYFRELLDVRNTDKVMNITTISFDIMVLEVWLPLISGAKLLICPQNISNNPVALVNFINDHRPSIIQATPTQYSLIVNHIMINHDMKILVGGEAVTDKLAQQLLNVTPNVYNVYGPTETTIWSTVKKLTADVTIGKPIANTTCKVIDAFGNIVPPGCIGELCIDGMGLSTGYHNRVELTAQKFNNGYRTGDLVRIVNNELVYIGRSDFQLKINGRRIELEEIISVMESYPSVNRAIVTANNNMLVGYYIGTEDNALIDHLKAILPYYMVPSMVIWLPRFPETLNGKIDIKALPDPFDKTTSLRFVHSNNHVEPRTEMECLLHDIFTDIIGCDKISVVESIMNFGASSITYPKLVNKIKEVTGKVITIEQLIKIGTIEGCAALLI